MEEEHARDTLNLCAKRFDEEVMDFEGTLIRANRMLRDLDFEIFGVRVSLDGSLVVGDGTLPLVPIPHGY